MADLPDDAVNDPTDAPASALTLASTFWQRAVQGARLMVGVPDYDAYVAHLREHHPDVRPLTRGDFFRAAQKARFGGRQGKCC